MATIFDLLDQIRARPTMHLGDIADGRARLQSLESLISGYTLAVRAHGFAEPVADLLRELGEYLRLTRGWSAAYGPMTAIADAASHGDRAWDDFWDLLAEYREQAEKRPAG